ncbi:MAG: dolichol-phosphate mannosyltransferase [Gammaproteobacteria bacterium]|nr:dolichol-phosphate mannosyltransferase [Gammaproteobacteria bacterium]
MPFKRYAGSGISCLHRISVLWVLADVALCGSALALGTPVGSAHVAVFIAIAAISSGLRLWREPAAPGSSARRTLLLLLLVAGLLALVVRSGVIELLTTHWAWSAYAAVVPAAIVTGVVLHRVRNSGADLHWRALLVALVGYAFFLRVLYSAQVELIPEETYYWNYCRHLDIGYLDHPPMVAWLIRVGTLLFGDTEFGVRFGALCCGTVSSFFIYRLTRNVFGESSALLALAMAQILPFFFLAGMIMTPDAPLTAAWAASMYFLERALIAGRGRAWIWAGLSLGLGLLSKYTIAMLGAGTVLFMALDPTSRRWFRRWEPYAAVCIAAAAFAPVLVWNAQHEWASFAFQTSRRLAEAPRFSLHRLVAAALVLLTPTGLLAVGVALVGAPPVQGTTSLEASPLRPWQFMRIAVLVPLSVFAVFSLRHDVKLDWTGAPWVAALPLLAFGAEPHGTGPLRRWLRSAWPVTLIGMLLFYGAGFYHLVLGIPGLGLTSHTELAPVEWRDFGRQIDGIADAARARYGDDLLVVGMDRYAIASERAFYSRDRSKSVAETSSWHLFGNMGLMYERWFPVERQTGRTLLLLGWDAGDLAAAHLQGHVSGLEPVQEGTLVRDGRVVRRYYYRIAHGYR